MKEYSKGIYVKFKPEEVEILHDRMKEAGVRNMSAYIRKMALKGYVIIPQWPDWNRVISVQARISKNSCTRNYIKRKILRNSEVLSFLLKEMLQHDRITV